MDTVQPKSRSSAFTLVCDDRCVVVRGLADIVKIWDSNDTFSLVRRDVIDEQTQPLVNELDNSPWSLLLIDDHSQRWSGPEAIPIILKNLPFGKIAAVLYILPGTMWITRQLYHMVSRVSRTGRRYA